MASDNTRQFREICRRAGLRLTPQRLEILRELAGDRTHPSAEELHRRLRKRLPTLSLDTVYRTLATLERLGIVARLQLAEGRARYDAGRPAHHHLVCRECGRIEDFSWPAFEDLPLPAGADQWVLEERRLEVRGLCRRCRAAAERAGVGTPPGPLSGS
ncbi:MAG: Fur family transcriptional regulator [Chloroflexota bacterium]